jgi:hypothetical protein
MAGIAAPNIVKDGLVFSVDAANPRSYPGSGTTVTDLIDNDHNGTLEDGASFNSSNLGVFTFDGNNDHIELDTSLNVLLDAIDEFSLSMWVKIETEDGTGNRLFQAEGASAGDSWKFSFQNHSNQIKFNTWSGTVNTLAASSYSFNVWYNMVGTFKANTRQKLYFNNTEVASSTPTTLRTSESGAKIRIGATGKNATLRSFDGMVSNVFLYTKELSAAEVAQNYNALKYRFE